MAATKHPLFDPPIVRRAIGDAFAKLEPAPHGAESGDVRRAGRQRAHHARRWCATSSTGRGDIGFTLQLALWLWFTVLFANFAEAMAEGRGKAQADTLAQVAARRPRAKRLTRRRAITLDFELGLRDRARRGRPRPRARRATSSRPTARWSRASRRWTNRRSPASPRPSSASPAATARRSPAAPRCCPTASSSASRANPGETFIDRMIALVEGASAAEDAERDRAHDPAVGADDHLPARGRHAAAVRDLQRRRRSPIPVLIALLVCLIPTTIGGLLSAIGIAGMDRMIQQNVIAMSGRAVEAAGDVNTLLLDKTGTITLGNRQAVEFLPRAGRRRSRSSPTARSSPRCRTRRPRAAASSCSPRSKFGLRGRDAAERRRHHRDATSSRSPRATRMSGVNLAATPAAQGRRRRGRALGRGERRRACPPRLDAGRRAHRARRAARRWSSPSGRTAAARVLGVDLPQGHREGRHARALRPAARDGHPHRHDHRRQPAHRGRDRARRPASTTSSPRRRRRTSWR